MSAKQQFALPIQPAKKSQAARKEEKRQLASYAEAAKQSAKESADTSTRKGTDQPGESSTRKGNVPEPEIVPQRVSEKKQPKSEQDKTKNRI